MSALTYKPRRGCQYCVRAFTCNARIPRADLGKVFECTRHESHAGDMHVACGVTDHQIAMCEFDKALPKLPPTVFKPDEQPHKPKSKRGKREDRINWKDETLFDL